MSPPLICVISCGSKKIWSTDPGAPREVLAKEAYTGLLFRKTRAYAERFFPGDWYILSDRYGLISPNRYIRDYQVSPSEIKGDAKFIERVKDQIQSMGLPPVTVATTSAKIHEEILKQVFPDAGIVNPVHGLTQGRRLQKLNLLLETRAIF